MPTSASRGALTVPGVLAGKAGIGPASWASHRASAPMTMKLPLANGCVASQSSHWLPLPSYCFYTMYN